MAHNFSARAGATGQMTRDINTQKHEKSRDILLSYVAGRHNAVAVGFEPTVAMNHTAFRVPHLRPLGHATLGELSFSYTCYMVRLVEKNPRS
jgi:hypothetical protein